MVGFMWPVGHYLPTPALDRSVELEVLQTLGLPRLECILPMFNISTKFDALHWIYVTPALYYDIFCAFRVDFVTIRLALRHLCFEVITVCFLRPYLTIVSHVSAVRDVMCSNVNVLWFIQEGMTSVIDKKPDAVAILRIAGKERVSEGYRDSEMSSTMPGTTELQHPHDPMDYP